VDRFRDKQTGRFIKAPKPPEALPSWFKPYAPMVAEVWSHVGEEDACIEIPKLLKEVPIFEV